MSDKITMKIINSEQFKRANIRFNGKPSDEVRTELKNAGWFYSKNHNVWYPKNEAAENSQVFAEYIQKKFFGESQEEEQSRIEEQTKINSEIDSLSPKARQVFELLNTQDRDISVENLLELVKKIDNAYESENIVIPEQKVEITQSGLINLDNEAEAMERANGIREMEAEMPFHTTEGNIYPDEVNEAKAKLGDIVRGTFLALTDEEKENGTAQENKEKRYNTWFRPMVDEIMDAVIKGDEDIIKKINDFELDKEKHVEGNKWYSAEEAYTRDVQYKLLPELYEAVQDKIKKQYEEQKIPYVIMYSSESPKFPSENKVYTVKEFNELLLQADSEFHNRKKYAEEKYGSADNYWDLENDDKLPEEDKGIQFGYDKTNFKFFNIPNPRDPEDTFSYEPSRYDIGDGNGSVFDYVRSTCSHDEFIEALNALETQLYFPGVTDSQRQFVEKTVEEATQNLKATLKEKMEDLDKAQNEYKELHKKWLIEATEADRVDEMLKNALDGVKDAYDSSMNDVFTKVLNEYPFASGDVAGSEFLKYTANEVKKMAVSELYLPSRNAQKAMNAEDYKTYNSIDWAKLRRIWEKFPANVNMTAYAEKLLQDKCAEKGMSVPELKTYHTLKKEDVENLQIISDEEFSDIVDSIILNDYKNIPNVVRLPNIKEELSDKLGLEKDSAFILKKEATHIRPDRKGNYNQALDTEEYREIPKVIRNADFAIVDKRTKNFMLVFDDKNETSKINKIVFNKDELGNYLVTIGKVDRRDGLSEKDNIVVGVGVAPTISALRFPEELPATRLRPSSTTIDSNISQSEEKSMEYPESTSHKISWVPLHNGRDTDYTYINGHSIERYFIWENENGENEYSVNIDGEDLCFIDDETNEEHKLFFTESELNKQIINDTLYYGNSLNTINKNTSTELTPEDIELCKMVIPPAQFKFTMELTEGEEGEFFKNKMKKIADTYRRINTDSELTNEDGTHTVGFRYFLGDTEIFLSEIDSDGIGFGYNILNGDLQMSEWGSTFLEEIMKIPYIEMDYHVPEGITIERMLYQEHPDYFAEYAPKEIEEKILSWDDITKFFDGNIKDFMPDVNSVRKEVEDENYDTELQEKEETVIRLLDDNIDWHAYADEGRKAVNDAELSDKVLEEKWALLEELSAKIVDGSMTSFDNAQIYLNDKLLNSELYKMVKDLEPVQETKPYNFFVSDTANLDLGIGAEFDAITGLTAELAAVKYAELKDKGLSPYIGLNIPGDIVFDDKEGQGAGIFTETDGKPSFYIGDNFIKQLKENNEHSQNVIAAYKELYETASKYILGVEKPSFVYEKENELNKPSEPLRVYTFSPFGYEGSIVQVETDLRRGIPAYDIVGIADSAVKETRERIRAAFANSGLEFPAERVLQSLSPADLRKDSPMDLSMALGILGQTKQYPVNEPVLALGELELSGRIRPVRGALAAVNTAKAEGITNIVCDPTTAELIKNVEGINILTAENLKEANEKLMNPENFKKTEQKLYKAETVQFNDEWMDEYKDAWDNTPMKGHFETVRAMEIAIAGKHNILTTGAPGCGKTLLTQTLFQALTPKLTEEESKPIARINSLAGLDSPKRDNTIPPFRIPHQTATIEGICGGGPNCRPGEISLAHNGTLFLDEAAEFRSSVIQMLRVPLESRQITLSRAGRSTSYPADFQLVMAMNPCPCGNYGTKDKICLDSARSIEMYWKKISDPLLDRVEIKNFCERDEKDDRKLTYDQMKTAIAKAYEIQRKRGVYNSHMTPEQIQQYCTLDKETQNYFDNNIQDVLTPRGKANLLKTALTIANMEGREFIQLNDVKEAYELVSPVFEKPRKFVLSQEQIDAAHLDEVHEDIADYKVDPYKEIKEEMSSAINSIYADYKIWELNKYEQINLHKAEQGNIAALTDLLSSLGIQNDSKFDSFYSLLNELPEELNHLNLLVRENSAAYNVERFSIPAKTVGEVELQYESANYRINKINQPVMSTETEYSNDKVINSLHMIDKVMEYDGSMTIKNPGLGDVIFANGTVGNIERNRNGGFGIKHVIEGRYLKDNMSNEDISALLYLIKDTVETVIPEETDKNRINVQKNGIWVGIAKSWLGTDEKWIVTGFGIKDESQELTKEAIDSIKAVSAQYGYAPEFLSISRQVGAVTSNIDSTIRSIKLSNNLERINNFRAIYKDSEVVQDFFKIDGVENGVESTLEEYKTRHKQKWAEFEEKEKLLKELGQQEFSFDDPGVNQKVISEAEKEREHILEPVLNGERSGMYKAFKEFEEKGVLEIKGSQVKLSKNGGLTPTGWKQLQAAMEIYRNKKFETFRYILIDEHTGEIKDQLAITSHMPNFCNVSKPNDETLKQVISRAEEIGCKIAICHNHPSGNINESSFDRELTDSIDRSLRRNDGTNKFLGHIILDHNSFRLAVPAERPGNCKWETMDTLQKSENDRFVADTKSEWAGAFVGGTGALKKVAERINDTNNWNDDFIPVVFTNADRDISGVQYYSKTFFENNSDKIRSEFQNAAKGVGAIGAFPVITDSLWNKLGKGASDFEKIMKEHVENNAFTDVAFDHTTMTEKYDVEPGENYYNFYRDQSDRKIDVDATWDPVVNPRLFPPEGVGERPVAEKIVKYNKQELQQIDCILHTTPKNLKLVVGDNILNQYVSRQLGIQNHNNLDLRKKKDLFVIKDDFFAKNKYLVPNVNIDKDHNIIRCTEKDLSILNLKPGTYNIHVTDEQLRQLTKHSINNAINNSNKNISVIKPEQLSKQQISLNKEFAVVESQNNFKKIFLEGKEPILVPKNKIEPESKIEHQEDSFEYDM